MQEKSDIETGQTGMGCRTVLMVIVGCFIFAGVIYFAGRSINGEKGSYYLFYSFLIFSILSAGVYQYFSVRKRKK